MDNLKNPKWWAAAGVRALKTLCQCAIATIGSSTMISAVDWKMVASASILSAMLSLLTSLAGLPEVPDEELVQKS